MKTLLSLCFSFLLLGCAVQGPVNSSQVVDDRPRLTLDIKGFDAHELDLYIDGVHYGSAEQYLNSRHALVLIAGPHHVEIFDGDRVVAEQTTYFGEGTLTTVKVRP